MAVSFVLPCYNPPDGWHENIFATYLTLSKTIGEQFQLIIVFDGVSASVTGEQVTFLKNNIPALKIIDYPVNKGKGHAIRQGVSASTGDIIIYTDLDFPYTVESMLAIYTNLVNNNCDVAVGVKGSNYYDNVPFMRRIISRYLRFMTGMVLSMPITDTQCGLKGFKVTAKQLFLKTTINRYLFDLEFIRNCFRSKKYRVLAVPVTLNEKVHFRNMDYRILMPEMLNFIKLLFNKTHE